MGRMVNMIVSDITRARSKKDKDSITDLTEGHKGPPLGVHEVQGASEALGQHLTL